MIKKYQIWRDISRLCYGTIQWNTKLGSN